MKIDNRKNNKGMVGRCGRKPTGKLTTTLGVTITTERKQQLKEKYPGKQLLQELKKLIDTL
jgi:hypothetical protein